MAEAMAVVAVDMEAEDTAAADMGVEVVCMAAEAAPILVAEALARLAAALPISVAPAERP